MFKLQIKLLNEHAVLPVFHKIGDAGLDLYACEDTIIGENDFQTIPLGFATSFDSAFVGVIKDRSSMALQKLHVFAGVIDSSYRNEWKVIIFNFGYQDYFIKKGDRIAQAIFMPCCHFEILKVDDLPESSRMGGFGSTGR